MGIDMSAMERPEGSDELPQGYQRDEAGDVQMSEPASAPKPAPAKPSAAPSNQSSAPKASTEEPDMSDERRKALKEKDAGNTAYKARSFDQAIEHYCAAWELDKDISFLSNLSGQCTSCRVCSLC